MNPERHAKVFVTVEVSTGELVFNGVAHDGGGAGLFCPGLNYIQIYQVTAASGPTVRDVSASNENFQHPRSVLADTIGFTSGKHAWDIVIGRTPGPYEELNRSSTSATYDMQNFTIGVVTADSPKRGWR